MREALSEDGTKVRADDGRRGGNYSCPHCGGRVFYHSARKVRHHEGRPSFHHDPNDDGADPKCPLRWGGDDELVVEDGLEVDLHDAWMKQAMATYFPGMPLKFEPSVIPGRRADLLLNEFIVIENQYAGITVEEWRARTADYAVHDYPVMWVWSTRTLRRGADRLTDLRSDNGKQPVATVVRECAGLSKGWFFVIDEERKLGACRLIAIADGRNPRHRRWQTWIDEVSQYPHLKRVNANLPTGEPGSLVFPHHDVPGRGHWEYRRFGPETVRLVPGNGHLVGHELTLADGSRGRVEFPSRRNPELLHLTLVDDPGRHLAVRVQEVLDDIGAQKKWEEGRDLYQASLIEYQRERARWNALRAEQETRYGQARQQYRLDLSLYDHARRQAVAGCVLFGEVVEGGAKAIFLKRRRRLRGFRRWIVVLMGREFEIRRLTFQDGKLADEGADEVPAQLVPCRRPTEPSSPTDLEPAPAKPMPPPMPRRPQARTAPADREISLKIADWMPRGTPVKAWTVKPRSGRGSSEEATIE